MKITHKGEIHRGWVGKWSCNDCGCKWELDASDPSPKYMSDQRDGDAYYMPCPTCGNTCYRYNNTRCGQWYR